jgi:hypothetical protein
VLTRGPLPRFLLGLGLLGAGAVAVVGGLSLQGSGPVAIGVAAVLAGCVGAGIARESTHARRRSVPEAALQSAAWTVAALLFLFGLGVLGGTAAAVVAAAVAATLGGGYWLMRLGAGEQPGPATGPLADVLGAAPSPGPRATGFRAVRPVSSAPVASALPPVSGMSTRALGREWLMTTAALAARLEPVARQAIVRRREETLDELERRDPGGFARWLAAGPESGSDPAEFVRGERRAGTDAA